MTKRIEGKISSGKNCCYFELLNRCLKNVICVRHHVALDCLPRTWNSFLLRLRLSLRQKILTTSLSAAISRYHRAIKKLSSRNKNKVEHERNIALITFIIWRGRKKNEKITMFTDAQPGFLLVVEKCRRFFFSFPNVDYLCLCSFPFQSLLIGRFYLLRHLK